MAIADRAKLVIDTGKMWSGVVISQIIGVVRGLIIPRLLTPAQYGIIGALSLTTQYAQYLDIGFHPTMRREIPRLSGKGDTDGIERVKETALAVNTITLVIYIITLIIYAIFFVKNIIVFWGIFAFSIFIILSRFQLYLNTLYEARQKFGVISISNILFAVLTLLLLIPLVYWKNLYGYFIGIVICEILVFIYLYSKKGEHLLVRYNWSRFKTLFIIGFPMFLMGIGGNILVTIDRIMVIKYLTRAELGYYTIAGTIATYILILHANISKVIGPTIYETWGRDENVEELKVYALRPTSSITSITGFLIALTMILMPILFQVIIPRYMPAVYPCAILLFAVYIRSTSVSVGEVLLAMNKQLKIFISQIISLLIAICTIYVFIRKGWALIGVATGEVIAIFVYNTILCIYAGRLVKFKLKDAVLFILDIIVPLTIISITVYYILNKIPSPPYLDFRGFKPHIIVGAKRVGFLILGFIPLFFYAQWRSSIFTVLLSSIKRIIKRGK
ncbi:MAG: oligosaccharide flippase family protein [bacterium]